MNAKIITSGKRKESVAKALIFEGTGKIKIKEKDYSLLHMFDRLRIEEPIKIYEKILGKLNFDADISVRGGGEKSQVEAARLALAKGMIKFSNSKELAKAFLSYDRNLLVADVRRKEAYKPGDSKARRHRQTSYR
jgi:small subunit ribosomal protein S9